MMGFLYNASHLVRLKARGASCVCKPVFITCEILLQSHDAASIHRGIEEYLILFTSYRDLDIVACWLAGIIRLTDPRHEAVRTLVVFVEELNTFPHLWIFAKELSARNFEFAINDVEKEILNGGARVELAVET